MSGPGRGGQEQGEARAQEGGITFDFMAIAGCAFVMMCNLNLLHVNLAQHADASVELRALSLNRNNKNTRTAHDHDEEHTKEQQTDRRTNRRKRTKDAQTALRKFFEQNQNINKKK